VPGARSPLITVGVLALSAQVVLLRELNVAFYGVELVYVLGLAAWMAGSAAGAACTPRALPATPGRLRWLLGVTALALPAGVALIRGHRYLLAAVPGAYLPFDRQLLLLVAATLPFSVAVGLAFRWAAAGYASRAGTLAGAYALESLGAAAAGLLTTLAFHVGTPTFTLATLIGGGVAAWAVATGDTRPWPARARRPYAEAVLAAVVAVAVWQSPPLDRAMTAWSHPHVIETLDSPYARITVTSASSQVSVFQDDVLTFESETADNEALPHLTALQHPAPRRMLLLGGSIERFDRSLRQHAPARLDIVEFDRQLADVAARQLGASRELIIADPRAFIRCAGRYDLIIIGMPEPTSGAANRFYTAEFFADCAARLGADGVLGLRLQLAENILAPPLVQRTASIVRALRASFPYVEILPGATAVVVASRAPLPQDPEILVARLRTRGIDARLITPPYLRYLYENDRRAELAAEIRRATAAVNRDARPACYQYAALIWITRFFPQLVRLDPSVFGEPWRWPPLARWAGFAALAAAVLAARRRSASRATALALVAGAAGMLLETVILLDYQAKSGALFEQIGMLLTAFMAGLALGAWWLAGPPGAGRPRSGGPPVLRVSAGLAGLAAITAAVAASGARTGLGGTCGLLVAVGAAVAALFACASAALPRPDERAGGRLYAADLVGGCAASVLASLVVIPAAGLVPTAVVVVGLAGVAALVGVRAAGPAPAAREWP
jgi:spermidine synthase